MKEHLELTKILTKTKKHDLCIDKIIKEDEFLNMI